MRRWVIATTLTVLVLGGSSTASAQEPGRFGLTMGYPPAIGLMIRVSDAFALRPEFTVSQTSLDTDISVTGSSLSTNNQADSWSYGVGVSALFYLGGSDNLRTYLSPRFSYQRSSSDTTSTTTGTVPPPAATTTTETTGNAYQIVGSFGAEYSLNSRFHVFGEIGAGYSDSETKAPGTGIPGSVTSVTTAKSFGIRTGAGVIWFF